MLDDANRLGESDRLDESVYGEAEREAEVLAERDRETDALDDRETEAPKETEGEAVAERDNGSV